MPKSNLKSKKNMKNTGKKITKKNIKQRKTKKYGKNLKKRTNTSKKNNTCKVYLKRGGKLQKYYWSPMRKLEYSPNNDSSLNQSELVVPEITTPAYNCKNPVQIIQNGGQECAYKPLGASSYAYNTPPGLSNGMIIQNNPIITGGSFKSKTKTIPKVIKTTKKYTKNIIVHKANTTLPEQKKRATIIKNKN
jgi:hypothetical protein